MKQKAAFFDIDGTVFRSSLLIELVEMLVTEQVFPNGARSQYEDAFTAWVNREGSYDEYISAVVESFHTHIQGIHYGVLADIGKRVVEEQSKHVYRYTRDLIQDLKGKDYYIVAISQSPKFMLDTFCSAYGFDKVYGRMYEIGPRDLFTGEVVDVSLISNKSAIIDRVVSHEDLDLAGSIGVGDTEGDIPLLERVDTPICFNPNMRLYTMAKKRGWSVVVERKDVVYTI